LLGAHLCLERTFAWSAPLLGAHLCLERTFAWSAPLLGAHLCLERTFAWLGQWRRLAKDYEQSPRSTEAFI